LRAKTDSLWLGSTLSHPADLETSATQNADGVTLRVHGKYSRNDLPAQFIEGGFTAIVRPTGALEIAYEFTPGQADGRMIEAGMSFVAAPAATEFRWIGQGPYPGYPAKDALDEFGIFHLSRDDLYFGGNRRGTEVAVLSTPAGNGFALITPPADVAVEATPEGVILSHNAALSSRGNKGNAAEVPLRVSSLKTIAGQFTLLPLGQAWPSALVRWVGPPTETVAVQKPFYRSYDQ
jgi:beta-galactosidase